MTKGEIRTFRFDFKQSDGSAYDLTGQSLIEVIFVNPSGTRSVKPATLNGPETDGSFQYTTVAADINVKGPWRAWGHFKIGSPTPTDEKYSQDPLEVYVAEAP